MRSWSRRYRLALLPIDDEETAARTQSLGPEGVSALEVALDSVRTWVLLDRALHEIRLRETPLLHPAVGDPAMRHWDTTVHETIETVLDQMNEAASGLAETIATTPPDDWARTGKAADGATIQSIDIIADAVSVGASNLRKIEMILSSLR